VGVVPYTVRMLTSSPRITPHARRRLSAIRSLDSRIRPDADAHARMLEVIGCIRLAAVAALLALAPGGRVEQKGKRTYTTQIQVYYRTTRIWPCALLWRKWGLHVQGRPLICEPRPSFANQSWVDARIRKSGNQNNKNTNTQLRSKLVWFAY
jgi:hypothetical protein